MAKERLARVGYDHHISNKCERNNCFSGIFKNNALGADSVTLWTNFKCPEIFKKKKKLRQVV